MVCNTFDLDVVEQYNLGSAKVTKNQQVMVSS